MEPLILHLLRHGEPEIVGRMLGRTDCPSTLIGIKECVDQVQELGIEALVASDLKRCAQPARAIGQSLGLAVVTDPRWRELDFGAWDGLAASQIDEGALSRFWDDPDTNKPPGGESWSSLVARVAAAIADIPPRPTLVVAHAGSIRAALSILCRFEQPQLWAFDIAYAGLLSLKVWPGTPPAAQIVGLRP